MKKCVYCKEDLRYDQDHTTNWRREPAHTMCDAEGDKRVFEERCFYCNTDRKNDKCTNEKCDGKTYIDYKGPK